MPSYVAYGLNVRSDVLLPELLPSEGEPDVVIRFRETHPSLDKDEEGLVLANDEEVLISFSTVGRFSVRRGNEIIVDSVPGASEGVARLILLGPCMGAILYQRGWLPLHASAVAAADGAIAFMAERGWGKSTTAAAMYSRGYWLVADDITALQVGDDGHPTVTPGYPQFKLWPDAAAFLGDAPEKLPRLNPDLDKRGRPVTTAFSTTPLPLKRIYVLDEGEAPRIEPLAPQQALTKLVHHTYGQRLFQTVRTAAHFLQCAKIVQSVPIRSLKRPYSLAALPEVTRLVEEDLARDA